MQEARTRLENVLREARPSWSKGDVARAQAKLEKVGVHSLEDLTNSLSSVGGEELNSLLKDAGEKTFSIGTLQMLKKHALLAKPAKSPGVGATALAKSANAHLESDSQDLQPDKVVNDLMKEKAPRPYEAAHDLMREKVNSSRKNVGTEKKDGEKQHGSRMQYESIPDYQALLSQLDFEEEQEYEDRQRERRLREAQEAQLFEFAAQEHLTARQLEDPTRFKELLQEMSELNNMTATRLQYEYEKRGFPAPEATSRNELVTLVKDAITCEFLRFPDLQERCRNRGLAVASDQPRAEILQLLAESSWESFGIPVTRFPSISVARDVLTKIVDLDTCDLQDLAARCRKFNLPHRDATSRQSMKLAMRQAIVWMNLSVVELQQDCQARNIEVVIDSTLPDSEIRLNLFQQLVTSMQSDRTGQLGIKAVASNQAEEVTRKLDQLQIMGHISLQSELRKHHVAFNPKADRQCLANQLRDIIVWKQLRIDDLKKECLKHGLEASGTRLALIESLLKKQNTTIELEARGIPVKRFANMKTLLDIASKFDFFEVRTKEELVDFYLDSGCPMERCLQRSELLEYFKKLSYWSAMSLELLEEEAVKYKLPADKRPAEEKGVDCAEFVERLRQNERRMAWESRGYFAARSINKFEDVVHLVDETEMYMRMSDFELKSYYRTTGLPMGNGSEDYLTLLKHALQWEFMPLPELYKACERRGISSKNASGMGEERAKSFIVTMFIVDMLKDSYTRRGFLVEQLGCEEAAHMVAQFDSFESSTMKELKDLAEKMGIVAPTHSDTPVLREFVQKFFVWGSLKNDGLWKTCETRGIPMNGFDRTRAADELREVLLIRLLLQLRAEHVQSGSVVRYIDIIKDPIMAERMCEVPSKPVMEDFDLPEEARTWSDLEAALFLLSSGKMNPTIERRPRGDDSDKELISVICPTSERRHSFHPLLYDNFTRQKHEPKELVVVDTGTMPSKFFLEKAREDSRIVYRHFVVDDMVTEQHLNKVERKLDIAWTLGMKRNIACYISRGTAIAQFDDDDLYSHDYLTWMWSKLKEAALQNGQDGVGPVAAKLVEWHLLEMSSLSFGYLDVANDTGIPVRDRRGWLYGWGFSYIFSREAWELAPFPDVEFAEDSGFYEGLMVRGVPVALVPYPEESRETGLVAHSHHNRSTSGGSAAFADGKRDVWSKCTIPKNFLPLIPIVSRLHRDARRESGTLVDRSRINPEKSKIDLGDKNLLQQEGLSPKPKQSAIGAPAWKPPTLQAKQFNGKGIKGGGKSPLQFKPQGPLPTLGQSMAPKKGSLIASLGKGGKGKGAPQV